MFSLFLLAKGAFQTDSLRLVKLLYIVMRVVAFVICLVCLAAVNFFLVWLCTMSEGNFVLLFLNPMTLLFNRLNHV